MKINKASIIINYSDSRIYVKFIELVLDNKRKMTLLHRENGPKTDIEFDSYQYSEIKEENYHTYLFYGR